MKIIAASVASLIIFINLMYGQYKPFPQNVHYPYGYQSTEISAATLQNAYNRWKGSFLKNCNGMYRVSGDDTTTTISEGMGYGMLLTAYFGEKEFFDGLFNFYNAKRTPDAYNLMGWKVNCGDITDPGSATDGDLDVTFALIVAYCQWGGTYLDEANNNISILKNHYVVNCSGTHTLKPGGNFGGCGLTDISYYTPAYFHIFAQVSGDAFWDTVAYDAYNILLNGANDSTGLVPDWQSFDGIPGGNPPSGRVNYYRYDASRVPWRMALDYIWNGYPDSRYWCTKITNFANSIGAGNIVDGYALNGTPNGQYNNSAFVGGFAVGAMCNSQTIVNSFTQRLLYLDGSGYDNRYFNLSLRCLYMLVLTGNFWQPEIFQVGVKSITSDLKEFKLMDNFPNPFNPSTTIKYSLIRSSQVTLTIYNLLGQKIKTLVDSFQSVGEHSLVWDATNEKNNPVSSGVYFYTMETNESSIQKKMILVR